MVEIEFFIPSHQYTELTDDTGSSSTWWRFQKGDHFIRCGYNLSVTYEQIITDLVDIGFLDELPTASWEYDLSIRTPLWTNWTDQESYCFLHPGEKLADIVLGGRRIEDNSFVYCRVGASEKFKAGGEIPIISSKEKPKEKSQDKPLDISAIATAITNVVVFIASVAAIISCLTDVHDFWKEKKSTKQAKLQKGNTTKRLNVTAIRLQMADGTEHTSEKWLTDPDSLKHYIDVLSDPSSSVKPVQVVFAQKGGRGIIVNASKGTPQNVQLEEVLRLLQED